jgi:hypothetical protein
MPMKMEKDGDHDERRAGDHPGAAGDPGGDGAGRGFAAPPPFPDPAQDEDVVVHRDAEKEREYSIEWLTCAFASRSDVVMVGLPGEFGIDPGLHGRRVADVLSVACGSM